MDTRIWMQESFWESAEEQNVKESPQENAEHLSKNQNENGSKDKSLAADVREYSGWNGILRDHAELPSFKLYTAIYRYSYDIRRTSETEAGKRMV